MPTIDQLAPAPAASDNDELMISQNGVARKITRGLLLAGVQPQIALGPKTLLGKSTPGTGDPEQITVGANLTLSGGTLSAAAAPYSVSALPSGTVPAAADLVPLGQSGLNTAVTYGQFMSGLSAIGNVDASKLLVRPTGSQATLKLADLAASTALTTGTTMVGPLSLAADPLQPMQAATKHYVDSRVQRSGDTMTGPLTLAGDPLLPMHAASKEYVDNTALPRSGGVLTGSLSLVSDPTQPLDAATKQYVDNRVQRSGDTMNGMLTLSADPVQPLDAASKRYVDSQTASRLSNSGGTISGNLTVTGTGQSSVQNGSLYIGNSDFQHSVFNTSGPQNALFNKVGSSTTDTSVLQSYYLVTHSGGSGHVINNLAVGTTVSSTPADGIWGFLTNLTSSSGGGNGGTTGHVAGYMQAVRSTVPIPSTTILTASAGNSVRLSDVTNFFTGYTAGVGYPLSQSHPLSIQINGNLYSAVACTPDNPGASSGPGTLTLSSPLSGTDGAAGQTVSGLVTGANLWAGVIEYREQVDLPSSKTGYGQTLELDWVGNNSDDADSRCFISAVVAKNSAAGSDVEVGNVLGVWPGAGANRSGGASIKRGLQINVPFSQAIIDARNATQKAGANAVWFADGHRLALSSDGAHTVSYDSTRGAIVITGPTLFTVPPIMPAYSVSALPAAPVAGSKAYASNGRKPGELAGSGTGVEVFADGSGRWISVLSGTPVQA